MDLKAASDALIGDVDQIYGQLRSGKRVPDDKLRMAVTVVDILDTAASPDLLKKAGAFPLFVNMNAWDQVVGELKRPLRTDLGPSDSIETRHMLNLIQQGERLRERCSDLGLDVPQQLSDSVDELSAAIHESAAAYQQRLSAEYQLWALGNIRSANDRCGEEASKAISNMLNEAERDPGKAANSSEIKTVLSQYPNFRKKLGELTGIYCYNEVTLAVDSKLLKDTVSTLDQFTGWKGQDELAKCLTRDMVEVRLMVIDESLLDRPVANLYNETFDKCWKYLEGSDHRVALAKASLKVRKLQPEDIVKP